jgi:hypothetical protein
MNRWTTILGGGFALATMLAWSGFAQGAFILTLQSGATTVSVPDNGSGDIDPTVGVITFTGPVGVYSTNITTGFSNEPGDTFGGLLQISSLNAHNGSGGQATLTATLEDTSFTQPATTSLALGSSLGLTVLRSTAGDSLSFQSYADPSNTQGGTAVTTGVQSFTFPTVSTSTSFSDTATSVQFTGSGPYSMKNVTSLTLSALGQLNVSGTTTVSATSGVPEPASLGMLLVGTGVLALRRRRRA